MFIHIQRDVKMCRMLHAFQNWRAGRSAPGTSDLRRTHERGWSVPALLSYTGIPESNQDFRLFLCIGTASALPGGRKETS
jgi:hypothetical protein